MSYQSSENDFTQFTHRLNKPNASAADTIRSVVSKRGSLGNPSIPISGEVTPMNRRNLFESVIYNELWASPELIARRGEIAELFAEDK